MTSEEKQVLHNMLGLLEDKLQKDIATIKDFKWLCDVPQSGQPYEDNKNIFHFQDSGIKKLKERYEFARQTILKLIK